MIQKDRWKILHVVNGQSARLGNLAYREGRDQEIAPTEKLNDPIGHFDDCIGVLGSHIFAKFCVFFSGRLCPYYS